MSPSDLQAAFAAMGVRDERALRRAIGRIDQGQAGRYDRIDQLDARMRAAREAERAAETRVDVGRANVEIAEAGAKRAAAKLAAILADPPLADLDAAERAAVEAMRETAAALKSELLRVGTRIAAFSERRWAATGAVADVLFFGAFDAIGALAPAIGPLIAAVLAPEKARISVLDYYAVSDPLAVPGLKFGVAALEASLEVADEAAELVNTMYAAFSLRGQMRHYRDTSSLDVYMAGQWRAELLRRVQVLAAFREQYPDAIPVDVSAQIGRIYTLANTFAVQVDAAVAAHAAMHEAAIEMLRGDKARRSAEQWLAAYTAALPAAQAELETARGALAAVRAEIQALQRVYDCLRARSAVSAARYTKLCALRSACAILRYAAIEPEDVDPDYPDRSEVEFARCMALISEVAHG